MSDLHGWFTERYKVSSPLNKQTLSDADFPDEEEKHQAPDTDGA